MHMKLLGALLCAIFGLTQASQARPKHQINALRARSPVQKQQPSLKSRFSARLPKRSSSGDSNSDDSSYPQLEPLLQENFPKVSFASSDDDRYYAFASSNGKNANVQVAQRKGSSWSSEWSLKEGQDALPYPGAWVKGYADGTITDRKVGAPDVYQIKDGLYAMVYSASLDTSSSMHCIGIAYSLKIDGPYTGLDKPIICPSSRGGATDPSFFLDEPKKGNGKGKLYIVYKSGGGPSEDDADAEESGENGKKGRIYLQQVNLKDGATKIGEPDELLSECARCNEGKQVEAPSLGKGPDGAYFLFFSSGAYDGKDYTIRYATSKTIDGDYKQQTNKPLFKTLHNTRTDGTGTSKRIINVDLDGPGSPDFDPESSILVFNAITETSPKLVRSMYAVKLKLGKRGQVKIQEWYKTAS